MNMTTQNSESSERVKESEREANVRTAKFPYLICSCSCQEVRVKANLAREEHGLKSLRYGSLGSLTLSTGLKYHIRGQTDRYSAFLFLLLQGDFSSSFMGFSSLP